MAQGDQFVKRRSAKRSGNRITVDMRKELDSLISDCYGEDEDPQTTTTSSGTPPLSPPLQQPIDVFSDISSDPTNCTDTQPSSNTSPENNNNITDEPMAPTSTEDSTDCMDAGDSGTPRFATRALNYSKSLNKIAIPKLNVDGNGRSSVSSNGKLERSGEHTIDISRSDSEGELIKPEFANIRKTSSPSPPSTPTSLSPPSTSPLSSSPLGTSPTTPTASSDKGRKSLFFENVATKAVKATILTTNTINGPEGAYTVYVMEVSSESGQVIQNVSKRFKNFSELVDKLKDRAPELPSMMPAKLILGNMAAKLVSHRKAQLQVMLDYILSHKELSRSVEVHAFFRNPTLLKQLASKPDFQGHLHKGLVGALGVKYIQMWAVLKSPCLYFCQSQAETAELKSAVVLRWLTVEIVDDATYTIELRPWQYLLFPSDPQSRPIPIRATSREDMFTWVKALHVAKAAVNDLLMLKKTMLQEEDPTGEMDLGDDDEPITPRQPPSQKTMLSISLDSVLTKQPSVPSIQDEPTKFGSASVPPSPRSGSSETVHRNRNQTQIAPVAPPPPKIVARSQTESQLSLTRKNDPLAPTSPHAIVRVSTPVSKLKDFAEKTDAPPLSRFEARMALMSGPPRYPPPSPGKMPARKPDDNPLVLSSHIPTPDTEENILLSTTKQQYIRGATANKLFEKVIDHTFTGTEYLDLVSAFLIGYRTFASPTELLDKLIQAYHFLNLLAFHASSSANSLRKSNGAEKVDPNTTRLCICNFISKWIDFHLHDFLADTNLVNKLITFLDSILQAPLANTEHSAVEKVKSTIKKKTRDVSIHHKEENQPQSILPPLFNVLVTASHTAIPYLVMDFDKVEVARHLCVLEFEAFAKILPTECLNQAWNKKNKETQAVNITAIIKRFNEVSCWVSSMIVTTEELKARTAVLARFVEIAEECRLFNNFNAVVAIVSGLESSAVHRLKRTWGGLPPQITETFEQLKNLMSTEKNYLTYRNVVKLATPPCIPYLGVFLTDLVFIDEAPDVLQPSGLINFDKWYRVAVVVREIRKFQVTHYPFRCVPEVLRSLANLPLLPENEIYSLSLKCEERKAS